MAQQTPETKVVRRLRAEMRCSKLTPEDVAKIVHVTPRAVRSWLSPTTSNHREPPEGLVELLERVCSETLPTVRLSTVELE